MVKDTTNRTEGDVTPESTEVTVEKLVYGGEGLARIDGQVVLIPYVLPGEVARVATKRVKSGLLRGATTAVLQPAPERVAPDCEYFGVCGGCHYQHASYEAQLRAKKSILQETLARLGHVEYTGEIGVKSGEPWGYRNRVQLHSQDGQIGYHQAGSHQLCPIDHCPISSPRLNECIRVLAQAVRQREWPSFLRSVELFTNETQVQVNVIDSVRPVAARFFDWMKSLLPDFAPGAIMYASAGRDYRIGRGSFFQVNRFLIDALIAETVGESVGKLALDLYAGVGLFTLPLVQSFERISAVERGGSAFRDLEWNVRDAQSDVELTKTPTEEFLIKVEEQPDLIVADPPRAGLGKQVTDELLRLRSSQIVLVSCDPATLARDLKALGATYFLDRLTLLDLFPQTYHFETVAHLRLR